MGGSCGRREAAARAQCGVGAELGATRDEILAFRRRTGSLGRRLPPGASSLCRAASAGLQDSVPRAAVLSLHARVAEVSSTSWEDPALVQVWGPRFAVWVVPAACRAAFTLGTRYDDERGRARAATLAARLRELASDAPIAYGEAGRLLGIDPNALRYASATGTMLVRWDGSRQAEVRVVSPPPGDPSEARLELARRYLHVYGPATPDGFARWAGIGRKAAGAAFRDLAGSLVAVRTPLGSAVLLAEDEGTLRLDEDAEGTVVRLLPSGDPYFLLWGPERELLVPDRRARDELWTPRVWPGAVLAGRHLVGTWRRSGAVVEVRAWRRLGARLREAIGSEASSLPLPGLGRRVTLRFVE